ncbi:MAG: 3-hydroxyacyl-CoA dehydrogenase [Chloroflexi bacterium]|nr:3-hydroxyacyl-CoA dehydrogenase [Chloroflexota bacterium]
MKLNEITAVITGGASGLGAGCARQFAANGARVLIIDRDQAQGMAIAGELGESARFVAADVTSESEVQGALAVAVTAFGGVHVLINCAGVVSGGRTVGKDGPHPLDEFERVIRINLIGTFNTLRLAAVLMAENPPNAAGERGVIVNTASIAAFDGQVGQAAYAASKGGVVGMTLPIARDLARSGIRVCTIAPGVFETAMMASLPEAARESLEQLVPFPPRLGRPVEYAQLAQAIIENPMLNGEVIRLDGALRMPSR